MIEDFERYADFSEARDIAAEFPSASYDQRVRIVQQSVQNFVTAKNPILGISGMLGILSVASVSQGMNQRKLVFSIWSLIVLVAVNAIALIVIAVKV